VIEIGGGAGVSTDEPGPMYETPELGGGPIGMPSGAGSRSAAHSPNATSANFPPVIKELSPPSKLGGNPGCTRRGALNNLAKKNQYP
jgi:hypothetical protein